MFRCDVSWKMTFDEVLERIEEVGDEVLAIEQSYQRLGLGHPGWDPEWQTKRRNLDELFELAEEMEAEEKEAEEGAPAEAFEAFETWALAQINQREAYEQYVGRRQGRR